MPTEAEMRRIRMYKAQRRIRGVDVTYQTDSGEIPLRVIRGDTKTSVEDGQSRVKIRSSVDDFLILLSELTIDEEQVWPLAGHKIVMEDESVYEVVQELAGEPAWRWSGTEKVVLRIHTDLVSGK